MTPEEFRVAGHALIDWIADERLAVRDRRVLPDVAPGDIRAMLPPTPPTVVDGSIGALLAELDRVVVPGMTTVQHPRHFGWFPSNASLASVLGDIASSGLGGLGISWESNPALTEVEEVMCDWMRQLCGLSDQWHGTIHDTASTVVLVALISAREKASDNSFAGGGLQAAPQPLVVYTTAQAHSSVGKAAVLAGFGTDNLRIVATDPNTYAMDPGALKAEIYADLAAGRRPAAVVASLGSTGVTAFDPLPPLADLCERHGIWLHVDAAMSGSAMLLPECRSLFDGVERADSLSWNPHKWMGTILDCSLYYVRDVEQLVRVMSTNPSYLKSTSSRQSKRAYDVTLPTRNGLPTRSTPLPAGGSLRRLPCRPYAYVMNRLAWPVRNSTRSPLGGFVESTPPARRSARPQPLMGGGWFGSPSESKGPSDQTSSSCGRCSSPRLPQPGDGAAV